MPLQERRQHFRIDDQIHFEYKILEAGSFISEKAIIEELLGKAGQRYLETTQYFQALDEQISELTQAIALKEAPLAHYLNLLNTKIDYLARHLMIGDKIQLRKVNISLGGMAFRSREHIKEKTRVKLVIYTKPKMIPIVLGAIVVNSLFLDEHSYRTAVQFEGLTHDQEQLLSQHIMLTQVQSRCD